MELLSVKETHEALGFSLSHIRPDPLLKLEEQNLITLVRTVSMNGKTKIEATRESVEVLKNMLNEKYVLFQDACKQYDYSERTLIYRIKTKGFKTLKLKNKRYILRTDLEDFEQLLKLTTSITEAAKILLMTLPALLKMCQTGEYFVGAFLFNGTWRIPNTEIKRAQKDIANLKKHYYTFREIKEKYKLKKSNKLSDRFEFIERPPIANAFDNVKGGSKFLYLKSSVDTFYETNLKKVAKRKEWAPTEVFEYYDWLIQNQLSSTIPKETLGLYERYAKQTLSASNANPRILRQMASELHVALNSIGEAVTTREIYELSGAAANALINREPRKTIKKRLYAFLIFCMNQRICKYTLREINNPHVSYQMKGEQDVYEFEEFIEIYNYAINKEWHIKEAISSQKYASSWLYVLIHLSNAWRHADVIRIPPVYPEAIGIDTMEWFHDYNLLLPQGQIIVNQLHNYELEISKTTMRRHFFCHQELVVPISTAMIICEFHRRISGSPSLISFCTSDNSPTKTMLGLFFSKDEKFTNFKFGSLKMNRSIMEHLYYSIQKRTGKGNSAFELVQKMRNHSSEVTKEYIRFTKEGGKISKSLFDRGEFGYIYDQLIDVLTEDNPPQLSLDERTETIKRLSQTMGVIEVEASIGFLDQMESEKSSIIHQLKKLDESQAFEYVRKLYLRQMPSKIKNVQCFSFPKCHRPSCEHSCFTCPLAIPNTYSMHTLFSDITRRFTKLKNAETDGVQKREKRALLKDLDLLSQAISEFGEQYVWSFFEGGAIGFEQELQLLEQEGY